MDFMLQNLNTNIDTSWYTLLEEEMSKTYFNKLTQYVQEEYKSKTIYPPNEEIFAAFDYCPVDKTKVVILGQDPYHGPNQAHGLCFSVKDPTPCPPSLKNIYKEIQSDLGQGIPHSGDLTRWAKQGVLLLNATLTVQAAKAGSHQKKGWEEFTDTAINKLQETKDNIVFLLWGSYAQKKGQMIDRQRHLVLEAPHPSPLSAHRGFFGCRHFSKTNTYLVQHNKSPILW
ncbi:uracil-DNA glycosylase [Spirochaeta cellobiosiphila]|uniref:uracil-DNA glycosylase n=1 Tax=Spirochaeta cellobiosiphila TaxID=504483 RepID=UPI002481828A|nr:uracil-DNA glycosylase [Spirochaeta cellobiosiphila]